MNGSFSFVLDVVLFVRSFPFNSFFTLLSLFTRIEGVCLSSLSAVDCNCLVEQQRRGRGREMKWEI